MIISINQPAYLPWLGYYHRIACADLHVELDHVQFEKNSFINRNRLRTATGWCWITVPVMTSGRYGALPIHSVEIADDARWTSKHWRTIEQNYHNAPYFCSHREFFAAIYNQHWSRLLDLIHVIDDYLLNAFSIRTQYLRSSELSVEGTKGDMILAICRAVGATTYLSGPLGRDYLVPEKFDEANITLRYDVFTHPIYPQTYHGFVPVMAAIDLLFNTGPEARRILLKNNLVNAP